MQHGYIDGIVDRSKLRTLVAIMLDLLGQQYRLTSPDKGSKQTLLEPQQSDAWDYVRLARHEDRPTSSDYIRTVFSNFVEIHGDRTSSDDESVICGFGQLGGQTIMVVGPRAAQNIGKRCLSGRLPQGTAGIRYGKKSSGCQS